MLSLSLAQNDHINQLLLYFWNYLKAENYLFLDEQVRFDLFCSVSIIFVLVDL